MESVPCITVSTLPLKVNLPNHWHIIACCIGMGSVYSYMCINAQLLSLLKSKQMAHHDNVEYIIIQPCRLNPLDISLAKSEPFLTINTTRKSPFSVHIQNMLTSYIKSGFWREIRLGHTASVCGITSLLRRMPVSAAALLRGSASQPYLSTLSQCP